MLLRIATRSSPLARLQAEIAAAAVEAAVDDIETELVFVRSHGDDDQSTPIESFGQAGIFTKALEAALLRGEADAAVHSAKDLPTTLGDGLSLAAFVERGDPRDALAGSTRLEQLPTGALIATGSPRRRAQLASVRPDLTFTDLRGNIATRLKMRSRCDGVIVAAVALDRLGMSGEVVERFDPAVILPAQGQGAITVETTEDGPAREIFESIDDLSVRTAVLAERACVGRLGGGCTAPVAAHAVLDSVTDDLILHAAVLSVDGHRSLRSSRVVRDPQSDGVVLADELIDAGAYELLDKPSRGLRND